MIKNRNMKKKIKTFVIATGLLLAAGTSAFAVEEYVSAIYKEIDTVFTHKSEAELNAILKKNQNDRFYYLIENYTEKKIRRLIVANDYDFALVATEIVIENNLDNERAVEMYSSIQDAYEDQKKYEEQQELIRQKEAARIEKEKESKRASVDKQYVASKSAGGGSVYISGKDNGAKDSGWYATLGLASVSILTEQEADVKAMNYGIAASYTYDHDAGPVNLGLDLGLDFRFIDLGSGDSKIPLFLDLDILGKIAPTKAFKYFFVRAGFTALMSGKSKDSVKTNPVINDFYTPAVGIQLERLPLGPLAFTMNLDYYPGHLFYDDIKAAVGAGANLSVPFTKLDQIKLSFNLGVKDRLFLKDGSIENRANIILAIGAENVGK